MFGSGSTLGGGKLTTVSVELTLINKCYMSTDLNKTIKFLSLFGCKVVTVQYRFPAKWLIMPPDVSTLNQPVEEVVITTILECRKLGLCGSDTVFFGLSEPLNQNRKQEY